MSDERAFELIGLPPTATEREVQRSYRTLALTRHPDRGGSAESMAELNEAHEVALEAARERAEREADEPAGCGCTDEGPSLACQVKGEWHLSGGTLKDGEMQVGGEFCPTCGGTKKVKVRNGFSVVELACQTCAVE
jgi:DnaJ-class molecular chaperone